MILIQQNINRLIKLKGMTKKEFAYKLIELKPTVSRIGEVPSLSAIYSYLNGRINIPVELIPYVAEVLDVTEQELFDTTEKAKRKCFKYFLETANNNELEYFNNFINSQIENNININYGKIVIGLKNGDKDIQKLVSLLEYAPKKFINKIINRLKEYKNLEYKDF